MLRSLYTYAELDGPTFDRLWARATISALVFAVLLFPGCGSDEPIRHYRVPNQAELFASNNVKKSDDARNNAVASGEPTDRMLGAIVPNGANTWFFKMTGPTDAVATQETAFRELIESLRFDGEQSPPKWTLPESWVENAGSGQRSATLSVEVSGRKLEVSVIQLTIAASLETVLDNVNRWRRQMGLPSIAGDEIDRETTSLKLTNTQATLVNLVGNFEGSSMGRSSLAGAPAKDSSGAMSPTVKTDAAIRYQKPDGWREEASDMFSQLAFGIRDADQSARITVSLFKGDGGDMVSNIDRWRGQVGLGPSPATWEDETEEFSVQDVVGRYIEVEGPGAIDTAAAIYGWIGEQQGQRWFIKMRGDAELVRDQRETFRSFLKSIKFTASDGAGDAE